MIHIIGYKATRPKGKTWITQLVDLGFCEWNDAISHIKIESIKKGTSWVLCLERKDKNRGIIVIAQSHNTWDEKLKENIPTRWENYYAAKFPDNSLIRRGYGLPMHIHMAFYTTTNIPWMKEENPIGISYRIIGVDTQEKVFAMAGGAHVDVKAIARKNRTEHIESWSVKPIILLR